MSPSTRSSDTRPWFWGFVGRAALATVVAWITLVLISLAGLLVFGGAVLGLISGGGSEADTTSQDLPSDFPTFEDEYTEEPPTEDPLEEVPVVLSATSDVAAEVSWSIGNESATETFTGEWTHEGTTVLDDFEMHEVVVTPLGLEEATTTCTITVDGKEADTGTATNDTSGTYCFG